MNIPEIAKKTLVHSGSSLNVFSNEMHFANGHVENWDFVEHRFNAAAVLPVLPNGNVLLVKQYRPACGRFTWEIPAGKRDDEGREDPFKCAVRELKEETGYASDDLSFLMSLRPAVAYSTEVICVYIAKNVYKSGEQDLDPGEEINVKEWRVSELKEMIKKGEIEDSKTIAAILTLG